MLGLCSELLRTAGAIEHIRWPCSTGSDCAGVAPRLGVKELSLYLENTLQYARHVKATSLS